MKSLLVRPWLVNFSTSASRRTKSFSNHVTELILLSSHRDQSVWCRWRNGALKQSAQMLIICPKSGLNSAFGFLPVGTYLFQDRHVTNPIPHILLWDPIITITIILYLASTLGLSAVLMECSCLFLIRQYIWYLLSRVYESESAN